jgi:hypothetical protein
MKLGSAVGAEGAIWSEAATGWAENAVAAGARKHKSVMGQGVSNRTADHEPEHKERSQLPDQFCSRSRWLDQHIDKRIEDDSTDAGNDAIDQRRRSLIERVLPDTGAKQRGESGEEQRPNND